MPQDKALDSSFDLLHEGYAFIQKRCAQFQSDLFRVRLMGMPVICMSGEEAARVFYNNDYFIRKGAVPKRVQKTLMGENGVQTMDDAAHRRRKEMFMSFMSPQSIEQLQTCFEQNWNAYLPQWEKMPQVVLFPEMQDILCLAACAWCGVPLRSTEAREKAHAFGHLVDAFGGIALRYWRGKQARRELEAWIMEIIRMIRTGELEPPAGTPAAVIAQHRDDSGKLLDLHMAAVELINLIRPIVAIATYITFGAKALHQHPQYVQGVATDEQQAEWFVQELRRYYPFAPFAGARVRADFEWNGYIFIKGTLVLLDLYGTNHDPRLWQDAETFRPERFAQWNGSPFNFIPQGGGEYLSGHRCAGERITIELTKKALRLLTTVMQYQVPPQDLTYSMSRMPTLPRSGFIMRNVRRVKQPVAGGMA